jgi:copper chaperone CopZ
MKKLLTILSITTLSFSAHAMHTGGKATGSIEGKGFKQQTCNYTDVKVNGLVCDFCATALEKVFSRKEEVSGIKVDLDHGNVVVNFKEGKTITDSELKELITNAGYDVVQLAKNECK